MTVQDDYIEVDENDVVKIEKPGPSTPEPPKVWPEAPAVDGMLYGFIDPSDEKTRLVVMTEATWTKMETQRRITQSRLEILSQENIEMKQGRQPTTGPRIVLPNG